MVILLAHGAGAPSSSPWMVGWKKRLSTIAPTMSFDYRYMREHRRAPDPLPKLIATHREALTIAEQHVYLSLDEETLPCVIERIAVGRP